MKYSIYLIMSALLLTSCMTMKTKDLEIGTTSSDAVTANEGVNAESQQHAPAEIAKQEEVTVDMEGRAADFVPDAYYVERIVYVERPIYIPEQEKISVSGEAAVAKSKDEAIRKPEAYVGGQMYYDYDSTFIYHIYTQPLRITTVKLQPGEELLGEPILGDTTRWVLGYQSVNVTGAEEQHIYIKPTLPFLETSMIINTTRRVYNILLRSYDNLYMPMVTWNYPRSAMPQVKINTSKQEQQPLSVNIGGQMMTVDPSLISTDYTMRHPSGKNTPMWLPTLVLDDAKKTYIYLPENVQYHEMPGVFMENGEIVNHRIEGNVIIIDRLIRVIELRLRNIKVTIRKKGA